MSAPAGQSAASGQCTTPSTSARSSALSPVQTYAILHGADPIKNTNPPLLTPPVPATECKKRSKFPVFSFRRRQAQPAKDASGQAEQERAEQPVTISCLACGQVGNHFTHQCPRPKECGHCFLPAHDAEDCEQQECLACCGRGQIKIEPGVNDHPEPTRRAKQAMIAGAKKVEVKAQEVFKEREKKLESGLTDAQREKLADLKRRRRDTWETILAHQDLHLDADEAYLACLISFEQEQAEREYAEQTQADQEAVT